MQVTASRPFPFRYARQNGTGACLGIQFVPASPFCAGTAWRARLGDASAAGNGQTRWATGASRLK